jgi:AcrR family transcriptional regulator
MKIDKVKKRDRERTKGKILKAVGEVIEQYGTDKVGVNLIARTAGVNKVLIYRYFESVDGLMEQYVKSGEYASTSGEDYAESIGTLPLEQRNQAMTDLMITFLRDLRERKATRDLLRWEIGTGKSILSETKNAVANRLLEKIGTLPNFEDTSGLMAFLSAGIYYLVMVEDYRPKMIDVDLGTEDGWKRIETIVERIISDIGK